MFLFILGLFVGGTVGVLAASLCVLAKNKDD